MVSRTGMRSKMESKTESRRALRAVQVVDSGLPAILPGLASAAPENCRQLSFLGAENPEIHPALSVIGEESKV